MNNLRYKSTFERILAASHEEIYVFDACTFKFLQVSQGSLKNLGYSKNEIHDLTPMDIKPEFTPTKFNQLVQPLYTGEKDLIYFETVHERKDGSVYDVDVRIQYIDDGDNPVFLALCRDITEEKLHEEELRYLAFRDPGTNLYNKRFFKEQLEVSVSRSNRDKLSFGLILLDLDNFNEINNTYGHVAGDALIKETGNRIDNVFTRRGDISARYGGDEFTILCFNMGPEMMSYKCEQLVKEIEKDFVYEGKTIPHSASVGLCYNNGGVTTTPDEMLECADEAMYAAKLNGKNQYKVKNI